MTVWQTQDEYFMWYERHELSCPGGWSMLNSIENLLNQHFTHTFLGSPVQFSQADCELVFYERKDERAAILEVTANIPQPLTKIEARFRVFIEAS